MIGPHVSPLVSTFGNVPANGLNSRRSVPDVLNFSSNKCPLATKSPLQPQPTGRDSRVLDWLSTNVSPRWGFRLCVHDPQGCRPGLSNLAPLGLCRWKPEENH